MCREKFNTIEMVTIAYEVSIDQQHYSYDMCCSKLVLNYYDYMLLW